MRWMGVCGWVGYGGIWGCVAVGGDVAVWLGRVRLAKHPTSFYYQRWDRWTQPSIRDCIAWVHHVGGQCVLRLYIACWNMGSMRAAMISHVDRDLIADLIAILLCSAIESLIVQLAMPSLYSCVVCDLIAQFPHVDIMVVFNDLIGFAI